MSTPAPLHRQPEPFIELAATPKKQQLKREAEHSTHTPRNKNQILR